ncbi:ABC transporter ATP-binding protein [Candidatus Clavichlamydia salmonicola]|uniref:ABC transporter ATP-binding protein n=1 Tax=Candidatus Clavichlamydia salmonicola TaxID=469812 RepID=UPI001890EC1C|nr:ABC transporter ATP-binding protein [Candidatus Clavichlamydia salmonicola]
MSTPTTPLLTVKNLRVSLMLSGKKYMAVNDISFDLIKGKTIALVGESGSGKSVATHAILGLLSTPPFLPPEGEVIYDNKNLLTCSDAQLRKIRGNRISMIFQNPQSTLNPVYTIEDQLSEVLETHQSMEKDESIFHILEALKQTHLPDPSRILSQYPHQLSGGMLQRVIIAMALLCKPDILIADEPTTALDVSIQHQILNLLKEIQQTHGMAILLITHDMGVVADIADDVFVMYAGEIIEQAPVLDLFDNMAHPYTKALFASRPGNTTNLARKKLQVISGSIPHITNYPTGCHFHTRCAYAMPSCQQGPIPIINQSQWHKVKCRLYEDEL